MEFWSSRGRVDMEFDQMLTPARTSVGALHTHGHVAAGACDHPHRPYLLHGEEDGAQPSRRQKFLKTEVVPEPTPPPVCLGGREEDVSCRWTGGKGSSSEPEEGRQGFGTEEKGTRAGEEVVGSPSRRVCSGCGTSRTPLWRSGPVGPKTLCNACGIRYRKMVRRGGSSSSTTATASAGGDRRQKRKAASEEVRKQGEKLARRREVLWMLLRESRRLAFRCGEEEAEAAVLLMAISSGLFVHTSH